MISGASTPIIPSSRQPAPIPRTASSTLPHPAVQSKSTTGGNSLKRTSTGTASIYDRNLTRRPPDVSLSAFAYIFCEMIQYTQKKATGIQDLEKKLNQLGYHVGQRVLELVALREGVKIAKRETKILGLLQFVHTTVWKTVFGRPADALERSTEAPNEYMIIDNNPLVNQFISVPREMSQLNCAAFVAGIIEAVVDGSLFTADVTAHTVETETYPQRTVFLVKFDESVMDRN